MNDVKKRSIELSLHSRYSTPTVDKISVNAERGFAITDADSLIPDIEEDDFR